MNLPVVTRRPAPGSNPVSRGRRCSWIASHSQTSPEHLHRLVARFVFRQASGVEGARGRPKIRAAPAERKLGPCGMPSHFTDFRSAGRAPAPARIGIGLEVAQVGNTGVRRSISTQGPCSVCVHPGAIDLAGQYSGALRWPLGAPQSQPIASHSFGPPIAGVIDELEVLAGSFTGREASLEGAATIHAVPAASRCRSRTRRSRGRPSKPVARIQARPVCANQRSGCARTLGHRPSRFAYAACVGFEAQPRALMSVSSSFLVLLLRGAGPKRDELAPRARSPAARGEQGAACVSSTRRPR